MSLAGYFIKDLKSAKAVIRALKDNDPALEELLVPLATWILILHEMQPHVGIDETGTGWSVNMACIHVLGVLLTWEPE